MIGHIEEITSQAEEMKENKQGVGVEEKHLKGYIFDSLMFRYQLARERQLLWEVRVENKEAGKARSNFNRDAVRFREILEEIIGEHD